MENQILDQLRAKAETLPRERSGNRHLEPEEWEQYAKATIDIILSNPNSDRAKRGVCVMSTAPNGLKHFVSLIAKKMQQNPAFKPVTPPPGYSCLKDLESDLKAVCAKMGFDYKYVDDFISMHKADGWKLPSGEPISKPAAIFTNYAKKRQRDANGADFAP